MSTTAFNSGVGENAPSNRLDLPRDQRRQFAFRPRFNADSFGRFAESVARFMGSGNFILWMTFVVVVWVAWNLLTPWDFDEYPFIFLTLALSLQASYAAPLILLAQNRQEARDRVIADQDRRVNAQAQADMEFLAREIASLRMALGEVATRDFVRAELRGMLEELAPAVPETPEDEAPKGTAKDAAS